jgi:hypothetical protein
MTSEQGRFIPLEDALRSFQTTADDVRAACQAKLVRAFYASQDELLGIHVCVEDMRKRFKEITPAAETERRSRFGTVVRWVTAAAGAGAVGWAGEEGVKAAWSFLCEHVFRSLPEPTPQSPRESTVGETPSPETSDRSMTHGRNYFTREGAGPGARTTSLGGGGGTSHRTPGNPGPGADPGTGGYTTRDGGSSRGRRTR